VVPMDLLPGSLLSIGQFSRLSLISVRMLRHYDQCGVLAPVTVDPLNGYRLYAPAQLVPAARIRMLRDLGCSVAEIGELLPGFTDPVAVVPALRLLRARLQDDVATAQTRLREINRLITQFSEDSMPIPVERTILPAITVAALRAVIPSYAAEGDLWQRLVPSALGAGAVVVPGGLMGATFHDDAYREQDVDVEIWVQVRAPFEADGEVRCEDRPAQAVASALLQGSYEGMAAATEAVGTWVGAHDVRITGPLTNVYRVGPAENPDPEQWVTQICLPLGEGRRP
jgi:DNA-binding transcriptional MerR regulator